MRRVDIIVSDDDTKLFLDLLKEKRLARLFIDNILNQNTIFVKTEKIAQKKKTITDTQELLQRVMDLVTSQDLPKQKKVQNFLKHLRFHVELMSLLQIAGVDIALLGELLKVVIKFLFVFCHNDSTNQTLLVPYATQLLSMHRYGIKISKLVHQIFKCTRNQRQERWLIDYLLNEVRGNVSTGTELSDASNPDIMRLLAALADSAAVKHSKYILKSLLAKHMQCYIMMEGEGVKQRDQLFWRWRREPKGEPSLAAKNHLYIISTISNCAEHCEYGRVQGRKLVSEDSIVSSLTAPNSTFVLKTVYLRLYYALYIFRRKGEEPMKEPPKGLASVLTVILEDLKKFSTYEAALESRKKRMPTLFKPSEKIEGPEAIGKTERPDQTREELKEGGGELDSPETVPVSVPEEKAEVLRNQKREDDLEYIHSPKYSSLV